MRMTLLNWFRDGIRDLFSWQSHRERIYLKTLATRESLDDQEFFDKYYSESNIPRELVAGVRSELQRILDCNLDALDPMDDIGIIFDDLDLGDVLYVMDRRLQVTNPGKYTTEEIDGTFDSMLQAIQRRM